MDRTRSSEVVDEVVFYDAVSSERAADLVGISNENVIKEQAVVVEIPQHQGERIGVTPFVGPVAMRVG